MKITQQLDWEGRNYTEFSFTDKMLGIANQQLDYHKFKLIYLIIKRELDKNLYWVGDTNPVDHPQVTGFLLKNQELIEQISTASLIDLYRPEPGLWSRPSNFKMRV